MRNPIGFSFLSLSLWSGGGTVDGKSSHDLLSFLRVARTYGLGDFSLPEINIVSALIRYIWEHLVCTFVTGRGGEGEREAETLQTRQSSQTNFFFFLQRRLGIVIAAAAEKGEGEREREREVEWEQKVKGAECKLSFRG